MPPTVTNSPSRRRSISVSAQSVLRRELGAHALERMLGDVEAERLLLEPQQLALVELGRGERRMLHLDRLVASPKAPSKIEAWPASRSAEMRWPWPSAASSAVEHPEPRGTGRVERSALHERLERALVQHLRVDALGELPDRLERPSVRAHADDRLGRRLADVLHRVQPEVDDAADDREVLLRGVHVRRQHVDPISRHALT